MTCYSTLAAFPMSITQFLGQYEHVPVCLQSECSSSVSHCSSQELKVLFKAEGAGVFSPKTLIFLITVNQHFTLVSI